MDKNQGYSILKAVMLENGRGFALGHHPTAPSPYVTWACYDDKNGQRQYEWGHYGNDLAAMEQDFADRLKDYQRLYHVGIVQTEAPGLYKYYSTQRPVDIGTFPKPPHNAPDEIVNYDRRIPVEGGAFLAWGHLTYTRPLTEKEASDYELRPAPVISELSRKNDDRPLPIAQQMKEAGALAEASQGDPIHMVCRSFSLFVSNLVCRGVIPPAIMGAFCLSSAACPFFCAQYSRSVTRFLLPFKRSIW